MTLRKKFIVLWGVIAATVLVCLGTSFSLGILLERELAWPYRHTTEALAALSEFEEHLYAQLDFFRVQKPEDAPDQFAHHHAAMLESLDSFEFVPGASGSAAASISRNLRDRVNAAAPICLQALESNDPATIDQATRYLDQIHALIERTDAQLLAESAQAIDYGQRMSRFHQIVTISGILAALLTGLLGSLLMQRWVVAPVQNLRIATREIAQGNFAYRLPEAERGDELARLSVEVNQMASTIETMQREAIDRERFAAVGMMVRRIVHNLRNPLAGIRNMAELTIRQAPSEPAITENQQTVIRSIDRFDEWLKDLLLATKNQEIDPRPVEPNQWLSRIVDALEPLAKAREASISIDCSDAPAQITVDATQFEQAVTAIVTNALQVSPPDSQVRIALASENRSDRWCLSIEDEGPGVPAELRERVYEPYFTTKPDGTGIGLATSRIIIQKHGGELGLHQENGHGARFVISMPTHPPEPASRSAETSQHPGAQWRES